MGIVRFALRFPHTFYVRAALILFLGVAAIRSMPTDIFPEIRIPVVTVIWSYVGLTTPGMEQRVGIDPTMSVVPTPNTSGCAESVSMDLSTPGTMAPANATGAAATPGVLPAGC